MFFSLSVQAEVAELADALHSGCSSRQGVEVRVLSSAPHTVASPDFFSSRVGRTCIQTHDKFRVPVSTALLLKASEILLDSTRQHEIVHASYKIDVGGVT